MTLPSMSKEDITWAWNQFGLPTILVFVGLGLFTGYLPSPLTEIQTEALAHKQDTKKSLREHRKQTRLMLDQCMDSKADHKKDPKDCLRILQEPQTANDNQE